MKLRYIIPTFFLICCSPKSYLIKQDLDLIKKELQRMELVDQYCANNGRAPKEFLTFPFERWVTYRDSVFRKHTAIIENYLNKYGYLGHNKVGTEDAQTFWLIAQHSDKNVNFQKKFLKKQKIEVDKNNANPADYAMLFDRVKINQGKKQLYATQVEYNKIGQAKPKALEDSINIDKRRLKYGLMPLKDYLNLLTKNHFEMNSDYFQKRGIVEPILYK